MKLIINSQYRRWPENKREKNIDQMRQIEKSIMKVNLNCVSIMWIPINDLNLPSKIRESQIRQESETLLYPQRFLII